MARPREFDENEVLDRATEAFWAHGYAATSVSHLMEATGLAKGSLYKGFGDKRSLFLRVLDRYMRAGRSHVRQELRSGARASQALEGFLRSLIESATGEGLRKGCFVVNCAIELGPHDAEVRRMLVEHGAKIEAIFTELLLAGIEQGDFREDLDPESGARYLGLFIDGLQVRGKQGMTSAQADEALDMAMSALR